MSFAKTLADCEMNDIVAGVLLQLLAMIRFISVCLGMVVRFFRARRSLLLENLALRQQLVVLKRRRRRWMKRASRDPGPATRWLTFLRNHREAIAAMDFFTVPTITFSALYCFFVISHDRRRILHFNVTKHPTSSWIVQQLREAFPFGSAPRFVHTWHPAQRHQNTDVEGDDRD